MPDLDSRHPLAVLGFACLLLLPSFDIPLKYLGVAGMVGYFVLGLAGIFVCWYLIVPRVVPAMDESVAMGLLLFGLVVMVAIAGVGYPLANSGRFGGGSDMDDALIIGATELVNGRYPYYTRTYLGGLLTPLPGAIILAIPFVVTGLIAFQNVFWLAAFGAAAKRFLGEWRWTLPAIATAALISPTFYQVLATGSDHITNTLYVLIALWAVLRTATGTAGWRYGWVLAAIFLGMGLSSRSNFLLLMPLLFSAVLQTSGWRAALRCCAVASVSFLAVTVPFWLYDRANFAPSLVQAGKLENLAAILPGATVLIPAASFLLVAALSFTRMRRDGAEFFRNCAIVQLFALYVPSLIYAAGQGRLTLFMGNAGYGMFTLFFAALSGWLYLKRDAETAD